MTSSQRVLDHVLTVGCLGQRVRREEGVLVWHVLAELKGGSGAPRFRFSFSRAESKQTSNVLDFLALHLDVEGVWCIWDIDFVEPKLRAGTHGNAQ